MNDRPAQRLARGISHDWEDFLRPCQIRRREWEQRYWHVPLMQVSEPQQPVLVVHAPPA
jgi:hypothetical protein